jgi:acyl carrier protein
MDERFIKLFSATLNVPVDEIKPESTTESLPQWSSLSHWELIASIEREYGIALTMDEATEYQNLGTV